MIKTANAVELGAPARKSSERYRDYDEAATVIGQMEDKEQGWLYDVLVKVTWCLTFLIPCSWLCCCRNVPEFNRVLLFRMGKFISMEGPGLVVVNPYIDQLRSIDLRIVVLNVKTQKMITKDRVTVGVNAIVYIKVVDPLKAVLEVEHHVTASHMFAASALRAAVGANDLDGLLIDRDRINIKLKDQIESETSKWGVSVTAVEIKDVTLPENMQRAMGTEAENESERRAKIISAMGEREAASELARAAQIISSTPGAMQLRYLHTLKNISVEKNSTIIFPLPMDLFEGFMTGSAKGQLGKLFGQQPDEAMAEHVVVDVKDHVATTEM